MKTHLPRYIVAALLACLSPQSELFAQVYTAADFKAGRLDIPLSRSVEPHPAAKQKMIAELNRFAQEDKESSNAGEVTSEQTIEHKAKRIDAMLKLISESPHAESSLTAILVIAKCSKSSQKQLYPTSLAALRKLREAHPTSWQARIAGMLEARLFYFSGRQQAEKVRLENAIQALKSACPDKEPQLNWTDPEFAAIRSFLKLPDSPPLRAAYLAMIAEYEYMMGYPGASLVDQFDSNWLTKARISFSSITNEFPDTEYAREAKGFIQTIDDIIKRER